MSSAVHFEPPRRMHATAHMQNGPCTWHAAVAQCEHKATKTHPSSAQALLKPTAPTASSQQLLRNKQACRGTAQWNTLGQQPPPHPSYLMEVICFTTSAAEMRSMRRLWILGAAAWRGGQWGEGRGKGGALVRQQQRNARGDGSGSS